MKTERTIKELLQLMLEHQELFVSGLCHWKGELWMKSLITFEENLSLGIFIANNRPSKYSSLDTYKYRNNLVFWKPCNIKPRIKWIKKHIARL
jgi:hypothetical protein